MVDKPPTGETFDFQSALMSLPGGLKTTLENIPASIPYLWPEEPLVALWREKLGNQGFKVGICWQGNPDYPGDSGRSIPLSCFQSLARVPGVRLISLQKHHGLDQLENLPSDIRVETLGQDFDNGPDAFVDTAAVMSCFDLSSPPTPRLRTLPAPSAVRFGSLSSRSRIGSGCSIGPIAPGIRR